ncbi:heat shock protein HslJ [Ereboglobus sp. PH5-10]|uniref:DUF306 domain-containing protein n=1 Tax=Ereboglobus luteus TaxID=1796921 RepID=A0A2U8E0P4_9BACT|nr:MULTISPECIES: META domain-containing protein [Ereboglobus]AWI08264.1 hypothetical protein CKA38_02395 [Ereboglobus luteus]MDF9826217.1 heat shock protein HslJ [Ereboglobus sp. PH5-10]
MTKHTRTIVSLTFIAALSLFVSACADKSAKPAVAAAATITQTDPAVLVSKSWRLESLGGVVLNASDYRGLPTLQFDATNTRAAGKSPVNNYSGLYKLDGTNLSFGMMVSTRMAGPQPDMELENKYNKIFPSVTGWRIVNGKLDLLGGETVLATFIEKVE